MIRVIFFFLLTQKQKILEKKKIQLFQFEAFINIVIEMVQALFKNKMTSFLYTNGSFQSN